MFGRRLYTTITMLVSTGKPFLRDRSQPQAYERKISKYNSLLQCVEELLMNLKEHFHVIYSIIYLSEGERENSQSVWLASRSHLFL